MKYPVYLLMVLWVVASCQIEDDNTPLPDESFIKYYGELAAYNAQDIELLYDSTGFIIFASVAVNNNSLGNYAVVRIDQQGNIIDSTYFTFKIKIPEPEGAGGSNTGNDRRIKGDDLASQIEVFEEGYAIVGTTLLNDNDLGVSSVTVGVVAFLDNELNVTDTLFIPAGNYLDGLNMEGNDIIRLSDGAFLFIGSREVNRGLIADFDFYIRKFSRSDGIIFDEIIGVPGNQQGNQDDMLVRAFEESSGKIVLIGYSADESELGENEGNNGMNVTYIALNANGKIENGVSYGIDNPDDATVYNETVNSVIKTHSGYAVAGTSQLSTGGTHAFFVNLTNDGLLVAADTLSSTLRSESGNILDTRGLAIVQGRDNNYVLIGEYVNFNAINQGNLSSRAGEAFFVNIDPFGQLISEAHFGTADGNDAAIDALALPDGKIVVLANVDFGSGIQLLSLIKLNDTGELVN